MDATKHDWRQTGAGCLAIILLIATAVLVGRCTAPTAAAQPTQTASVETLEWSGYDLHTHAGIALEQLQVFLDSVTTTTTISLRPAANPEAAPPVAPSSDRWDQLAQCETGGNWATNTGNGYGGGLQFAHQPSWSTWLSFGGGDYAPHPWEASRDQQIAIAEKVLASSGWNAWPGCSRKFGWT